MIPLQHGHGFTSVHRVVVPLQSYIAVVFYKSSMFRCKIVNERILEQNKTVKDSKFHIAVVRTLESFQSPRF